tara:strand:- start:1333 stop:1815 length:483 start_codon:yes stop_codon:yes gene_type:complete
MKYKVSKQVLKRFNKNTRMVRHENEITDQCLFDPEGNKGNAYMQTIHYKKAKEALEEKLDVKMKGYHFITYANSYLKENIIVAYHLSGVKRPIEPQLAHALVFGNLESVKAGFLNLNTSYRMRVICMPLNAMLPYKGCTCPKCCRADYIGGSNVHDSCKN